MVSNMIQTPRVGMYAGSWPQNIGNAFFDLGAEAIIRTLMPNALITRTGGAVHWMFNNSSTSSKSYLGRGIRKVFPEFHTENGNSIEISSIGKFDLIVFAGMSMTTEFVRNNARSLIAANRNGAAILGLGTGASSYSKNETQVFAKFFNSLDNSAIVTRDRETYENFLPYLKNISSGIDSAFFLPEFFTPPELVIENFDMFVFDNIRLPKNLVADKKTLYAHHDMWGPLPKKYVSKKDTLVSDVPEDYLSLYANCHTVYSDRVHACVATLAYGNAAKLFTNSPRKSLFKEVGAEEIGNKIVTLNQESFGKWKAQHLQNVSLVIDSLFGK